MLRYKNSLLERILLEKGKNIPLSSIPCSPRAARIKERYCNCDCELLKPIPFPFPASESTQQFKLT